MAHLRACNPAPEPAILPSITVEPESGSDSDSGDEDPDQQLASLPAHFTYAGEAREARTVRPAYA